ncbi:hypothetical protein GMLC_00930 [Geomonas limicola]|uniref:DUF4154 domain-containing protein n=1 Tax=Geomonas limicola TaxID=2740186 RepID=A0A6V8N3G3_9BACT|nr:YfiR family protein [Geomonas limicola]GFO66514.1 hypothetical protein GMLC_00930 [Geomonas limicola]
MATRSVLFWVTCIVTLLLVSLPSGGGAETSSGEYSLKAAFIYNFTKYLEWPPGSLHRSEFCIATLGRTPLDRSLSGLTGRLVQGHPIVFRQVSSPEEAAQCQILFVSRSELGRFDGILSALGDLPILTISDREDFCRRGGMLALYQENGKIAFEVNLNETQRCRLKVSAQLLKMARKVYGHQ